MTHRHDPSGAQDARSFLKAPAGSVFCGMLTIGAVYLAIEHTAHLFGVLPWLFLLACPLMHLFMHGAHGGRGRKGAQQKSDPVSGSGSGVGNASSSEQRT